MAFLLKSQVCKSKRTAPCSFAQASTSANSLALDTYTKLCTKTKDGEGLPVSPEFSNLVVKSACLSNNRKFVNKTIKLYDVRDEVEFITVVITYAHKRDITVGSKLTDRYGKSPRILRGHYHLRPERVSDKRPRIDGELLYQRTRDGQHSVKGQSAAETCDH